MIPFFTCASIHVAAILAAVIVPSVADDAAAGFLPATPPNTLLADGKALPEKPGSIGWTWQAEEGNGGLWIGRANSPVSPQSLMVKASGLEAGALYEVFAYFWDEEYPSNPHDSIQLGLSLATLHPFAGPRPDDLIQKEPWLITPGYKTGEAIGWIATVESRERLPDLTHLKVSWGTCHLIRARLGYSRAGKDGTLPVFFSINLATRSPGTARMDGIALRRAADPAPPEDGRKPGNQLHLAVRAGDTVTMRREIEAGADVNGLDEENLTPLFHAAASGNGDLVRMLLDHGAKPELPGQSVAPLTAAATAADLQMIGMLLERGARVPTSPSWDRGALPVELDPRLVHPLVAAIRSGSVPSLKMLLAANPEISLLRFEADLQSHSAGPRPELQPMFQAGDAMLSMDWEMAAFLIDNGAAITCRNYAHYTSPEGLMLADAVHTWPDSRLLVEAMLRRGEQAVTKTRSTSDDALNTAALHGHAELVRRFLPQHGDFTPYYWNGLLENALSSGNEEVVAMIRERFPEAKRMQWIPPEKDGDTPELEGSAKRWFLPRTSPPPDAEKQQAEGKHVLAVVAAPDAKGTGDLLAAQASRSAAWQVVDREQLETALAEDRFSKPWADGAHRLSEIGDQLQADCMIVVSAIRGGGETIHRFEVVAVNTGLEIHREHFGNDAFADPKEIEGLLDRSAHALALAGANTRHEAVTLLTFSAQGRTNNPLAATGLLRAAIQHEVDSTPGLISLSRAQSARLMEEQALGGKDSVWGAAHMVEGAMETREDGNIVVKLRLETLKAGGNSVRTDAESIGKPTEIAQTAVAAWKKLVEASGNQIRIPAGVPDDPNRALAEGRRLVREADWLHAIYADPSTYLPLIESAIALGVPARDTILIDLDARFRKFFFLGPEDSKAGQHPQERNTTSLQYLHRKFESHSYEQTTRARWDQLAQHLPAARELLHQTSWYLEQLGPEGLDGGTDLWQDYKPYKSNEIWYAIQALSMARCVIYPAHVTEQVRAEFEAFSEDLDVLTRRYFALLKTLPEPDFYRYYPQVTHPHLFKHNPALAEGMVEMAASGACPALLMRLWDNSNDQFQWMLPCRELARKMLARIGDDPSPRLRIARADLECFLADAGGRPAAIRTLVETWARLRWQLAPSREVSTTILASEGIINQCTTSWRFDWRQDTTSLEHNGSLLPSVLLSTSPAPDFRIRFSTYHKLFPMINSREAWGRTKAGGNIDTFRASIGAYDQWELARLKSESSPQRKVNGRPSRNVTSSFGAPPIPMTKPAAKILHSLIFGAGKINQPKERAKDPPATKPQPAPLEANLLADLRTDSSPGTFIWPLVDRSDPSLLWMFYFPSAGDDIRVRRPEGGDLANYGHRCKAPWLLGINCRDGSLTRKIDLHASVGQAYGIDLSNRTCEVWKMALDQTNDRILTAVGWHDPGYASNKMGSIIIDKNTGKAHPIPGNPEIDEGEGDVSLDLWDRDNGVAAAGDHFFFLDRASMSKGSAVEEVRSEALAVFQVFPDLSVKPLTVMGRRPELTPFDAQNRAPISITAHDERLMVIHPSTIAEYDPVAAEWSITASLPSEKPGKKHTNTVADAQYWEYLRAINELRMNGQSTGWIAVSWAQIPGVLPFASREKGRRDIPIQTLIPEAFLTKTFATEEIRAQDGGRSHNKTRFQDHVRFKKPCVVVLAQTESDLILGIQNGPFYGWTYPSRNTHHLPFLWKVSKQDILRILREEAP